MRTLNPGYKFLTILIVSLMLSFSGNVRLNLLIFALAVITLVCTPGVNKKRMLLAFVPFLLAAAGMFTVGLLFSSAPPGADVEVVTVTINVTSLQSALHLSSRVLAFGGVGLLFAMTTGAMDFVMSLMQQFSLPPKFAYGLLAAYHFFPVVRSEYRIVRGSLAVRGVRAGPLSPKCLMPMLVHAFERSESLAMAMESRGFDSDAKRAVAFAVPLRKRDFLFLAGCILGTAAGLAFL